MFALRRDVLNQVHACRMPPTGAPPLPSEGRTALQAWGDGKIGNYGTRKQYVSRAFALYQAFAAADAAAASSARQDGR